MQVLELQCLYMDSAYKLKPAKQIFVSPQQYFKVREKYVY